MGDIFRAQATLRFDQQSLNPTILNHYKDHALNNHNKIFHEEKQMLK